MSPKEKILISIDRNLIIRLGEMLGGKTIHSQREIANLNFLLNNSALNKFGEPSKFGRIVFLVLPKVKEELDNNTIGKYHKEENQLLKRMIPLDIHPKRDFSFLNDSIEDQAQFFNLLHLVSYEATTLQNNSRTIGLTNFVISCKRGIKFPEMKNKDCLSPTTTKQLSFTKQDEKIFVD